MNQNKNKIFDDLIDFLNKNDLLKSSIKMCNKHKDGRKNSAEAEFVISNTIKINNENISIPEDPRHWFDIEINGIPCNIKVIDGKHSDNANCKLGIYFAITGHRPNFSNEIDHKEFIFKLRTGMDDPNITRDEVDYIFILFSKKEEKFNWVGLKQIIDIIPNGNNLPFQINFTKAIKNKSINLTIEQNIKILVGGYKKSGELRNTVDEGFSDGRYL